MAKGKKIGGQEKGTLNILKKELRTSLKNLLADEIDNIPEQLQKLEPKDRLEIIIKLLPYALPKVEPVSIDENEPFVLGDEW